MIYTIDPNDDAATAVRRFHKALVDTLRDQGSDLSHDFSNPYYVADRIEAIKLKSLSLVVGAVAGPAHEPEDNDT